MTTEIWVAIITFLGVIYSATVGLFYRKIGQVKNEHKEEIHKAALAAEDRHTFHAQVTDPFYPAREWTKFVDTVYQILEETEIDRLLVLVAVNGAQNPTHASCIVDFRQVGKQYSYVDVPLDQDYIERLIHIKKKGIIRFKTKDVPNTLIGEIYSNEGVTECVWSIVGKKHSFTTDQVAYKFISVATHREGGFSNPKEIERVVRTLTADFRGMLSVSGFGPV